MCLYKKKYKPRIGGPSELAALSGRFVRLAQKPALRARPKNRTLMLNPIPSYPSSLNPVTSERHLHSPVLFSDTFTELINFYVGLFDFLDDLKLW